MHKQASIAQWQSVGLVNQRSWVQSSLEAKIFFWNSPIFECIRCEILHLANIPWKTSKIFVTPTWFEHAAFWSGVRRATVAPRSLIIKTREKLQCRKKCLQHKRNEGSTEIWTRIAGFKVQSANHYTIEPWHVQLFSQTKLHLTTVSFWLVFSAQCGTTFHWSKHFT